MDRCSRRLHLLRKLFNVCPLPPYLRPLFEEQNANVVLVWEKTKRDRRVRQMAEENKIEMEDEEGNVMSAKTYNDLKAQGII